jgi:hypothetical protein
MSDPKPNTSEHISVNEDKKSGSFWVFWWAEDVFDNNDILKPVDGFEDIGKTLESQYHEVKQNTTVDMVDDQEDYDNEVEFDPIFTEKKIDSEPLHPENNKESWISKEIKHPQEVLEDFANQVEQESELQQIEKELEITSPSQEKNEEEIKADLEPKRKSEVMNKFLDLVDKTTELYTLAEMEEDEYVELIGGSTGKSEILYNLWYIKETIWEWSILISKIETDNQTQESQQNNLQFKEKNWLLEVFLDEQLLYEEADFQEDHNKKMQVLDKLNKFIFLVSEEIKIYEREKKEKERMEQERRKLRDIFRNF